MPKINDFGAFVHFFVVFCWKIGKGRGKGKGKGKRTADDEDEETENKEEEELKKNMFLQFFCENDVLSTIFDDFDKYFLNFWPKTKCSILTKIRLVKIFQFPIFIFMILSLGKSFCPVLHHEN